MAHRRAYGMEKRVLRALRTTSSIGERGVAMQLTGHKTRAVFERYNIVSAGDLRDAVLRLDRFASISTS